MKYLRIKLKKVMNYNNLLNIFSFSLAFFVIYALIFYPLPANIFRCGGALIACLIIFVKEPRNKFEKVLNIIFIISIIITFTYVIYNIDNIMERGGISNTTADIVLGTILIVIILEGARRSIGSALSIISLACIFYVWIGQFVPGVFGHRGYSYERLISTLLGYGGVFGLPLTVALTYLILFVTFGSFLENTGTGDAFLDLAKAISGKSRGGPAKIAVIASGFFGSISGSAVANVAATGSFTIPLMIKIGYKKIFAGAVEATASTGGLFMPPVMAAGAFLMAEILGTSYLQIIKAAALPAILYYIIIWIVIDLRAQQLGLKGLPPEKIPRLLNILRKDGYKLIPILVLMYTLVIIKFSPLRCAFYSIITTIAIFMVVKRNIRETLKLVVNSLVKGGKGSAKIILACACAGLVIGSIGLTGLAQKIAAMIMLVGGDNAFLALLLGMLTAIIFGMGLPATVSYIICIVMVGPALIAFGFLPIAVHLFVFYYACVSGITPPVALAAYTAAGISGGNPTMTGWQSFKLAIPGFVLPFIFIYNYSLLLQNSTFLDVIYIVLQALICCFAFAVALEGYFLIKLNKLLRLLLLISGFFLVNSNLKILNLLGFISLGLTLLIIFKNSITVKRLKYIK